MLHGELLALVMSDVRNDMQSNGVSVGLLGTRAAMNDDLIQPPMKELFHGSLLWRKVDTSRHVTVKCLELIGDFLPGFAVDIFSLAPPVRVATEIDNRTPTAIWPQVNTAFAVPSTLAHRQPPVYSRVHVPSLRVVFHPGTVGLCCEVLPGGTKWGVIWLPYSKICMRSHAWQHT